MTDQQIAELEALRSDLHSQPRDSMWDAEVWRGKKAAYEIQLLAAAPELFATIRTLRAQVEELDKKWHEERSSHLHYKEIAESYGQQRDALAQPIRHELEVWLCPVHASLDEDGLLASLDKCVACIRVERDELRAELRAVHAEKDARIAALESSNGNAFVEGAKWWEFESTKGTMWQQDQANAAIEAERRGYTFKPSVEKLLEAKIAELERQLAEMRGDGDRLNWALDNRAVVIDGTVYADCAWQSGKCVMEYFGPITYSLPKQRRAAIDCARARGKDVQP